MVILESDAMQNLRKIYDKFQLIYSCVRSHFKFCLLVKHKIKSDVLYWLSMEWSEYWFSLFFYVTTCTQLTKDGTYDPFSRVTTFFVWFLNVINILSSTIFLSLSACYWNSINGYVWWTCGIPEMWHYTWIIYMY